MRQRVLAFADRHLSPYRMRGDELIPALCPICGGGARQDRESFALNLNEGLFVCKRGSCGARGRFEDLNAMFGEPGNIMRPTLERPKKAYAKPDL